MKLIKSSSKNLEKIYNRYLNRNRRIEERVRKIIEDVRTFGDEAIVKYTKRFDKVKLLPKQFRVTEIETSGAYQNISPQFVSTLKIIIENINKFYRKQIRKSWRIKDEDGVILGERYEPIEKVGIYIPSGTVPLVSSVYMTVCLAKMAGVKKIILVTPPNNEGSVNPYILVVANLLKVDEIYKVGGAQAIAALAFGTKTIPKVDKIVGPGNVYVTEAKRQVFGYCDIDMVAGPTEVVIIANQYSNPLFVINDLLAGDEHFMGTSILVTTSKTLAKTVKSQIKIKNSFIVLVKNLEEAVEVVNRIAPEHLQILIKNPQRIIKKIKNAGCIFIGPYTPTAVGDYVAGPSHVLPTGGTARFFSGLGIDDFIKSSHLISYSKKGLEKAKELIERLSTIEGLPKHLESVKVRFE